MAKHIAAVDADGAANCTNRVGGREVLYVVQVLRSKMLVSIHATSGHDAVDGASSGCATEGGANCTFIVLCKRRAVNDASEVMGKVLPVVTCERSADHLDLGYEGDAGRDIVMCGQRIRHKRFILWCQSPR